MADGLAAAGARVAVLGRRRDAAEDKAEEMRERRRGDGARGRRARRGAAAARDELLRAWGRVDVLVNAAGGNVARARTDGRRLRRAVDAFDEVVRLNLHGTVVPSMAFGEDGPQGAAASSTSRRWRRMQAISGVLGYSVAKAASTTSPGGWRSTWRASTAPACA